jgi:hypothetical protein
MPRVQVRYWLSAVVRCGAYRIQVFRPFTNYCAMTFRLILTGEKWEMWLPLLRLSVGWGEGRLGSA